MEADVQGDWRGRGGMARHRMMRPKAACTPATLSQTLDAGSLMLQARSIRHCRACCAPTVYRLPADDNRERAICTACETIHYENPLNVVGTLPVWEGRVLLCLRNIEPRR